MGRRQRQRGIRDSPRSGRLFDAWQGFQWTHDCKESLLAKLYQRRFQKASRENGNSNEHAIQEQWEAVAHSCMQQPDIRLMCDAMLEEVGALECDNDLLWQSQRSPTRTSQDTDSGFCVDIVDQVKGGAGAFTCAIQ